MSNIELEMRIKESVNWESIEDIEAWAEANGFKVNKIGFDSEMTKNKIIIDGMKDNKLISSLINMDEEDIEDTFEFKLIYKKV